MNTNIRIYASDFMDAIQVLYQNGCITAEERKELVQLFRDFLGGDKISGNKLEASLRNIFHQSNTTMFAKQQIEKMLCLIS